MHREYHPADLHHLRAHAFEEGGHLGHHEDHRGLYALTALLGTLIAGDLVFGGLGWEAFRAPLGVSLVLVAAVLGSFRIVYGAIEALVHRRIGADFALAQASIAALVIGQPFVAAEVVFIALVGEVLEAVTFERAQRAIHRLLDQTPRTARVRRGGEEVEVPAGAVVVGDLVIVRPGERIAVDGPVVAGRSTVDQSALTGESLPIDKGEGDPVYTGTLNQFGVIEVRAEKVGQESTFGQVLRLIAEAQHRKAPLQRAADRLARYFLPVVETAAGATLIAGSLLGWPDVWFRTVAVLVVACPCALVLATPAAILASMAWLARHGVLIKGGAAIERLAACDSFAFDKTGTLTRGRPEVASVVLFGDWPEPELLRIAASAEASSQHPLAQAVTLESRRRGLPPLEASEVIALPGAGVSASCRLAEGQEARVLIGNRRLLAEHAVALGPEADSALAELDARGETALLVAIGGRLAGLIGLRDEVRPEAHDVIHDLKHLGISEIAILTGDRASAAKAVARKTHVKVFESELLPADKAKWIEDRQASGRRFAMVGDGINDAPALAGAHVGIALGGIGADLAAEAGDLIVLGEPLLVLPDLVRLSRATVAIIRQNIFGFAFGLNALAMASASLGILGPVAAAILHQAGSFLVLLNAMRLLGFGGWGKLGPVRAFRALGGAVARFDDRHDPGLALQRLMGRWRSLAALGILGVVVAYSTSGWASIGPGEVGLVRRQGRFLGVLRPGLHLRWPVPWERVTRLDSGRIRGLEIGFRSARNRAPSAMRWESGHERGAIARAEDEALLITGDGQLVELSATAQYRIDDRRPEALRRYAFETFDADQALRPLAESVVRSVIAQRKLDELLTTGRGEAERLASKLLQERVLEYGLGLVVAGIAFQDVHPPLEVVDAYRDVSRAESERLRRENEGRTYLAEEVAKAEGRASTILNGASAERNGRVKRAQGESDAFLALLSARSAFPRLTDLRIYWEAMALTLSEKRKLVLDMDKDHPRRLIVPDGSGSPVPAILGPPLLPPLREAGGP